MLGSDQPGRRVHRPLIARFTRLRVVEHKDGSPGQDLWLLLRLNADGEIKATPSNAPADLP
ncbi:MAG TPA: hypothetical protein VLH18_02580, partial [Candidatus Limnocylindrales bacterium]|nr:hypothetical protein [Candidatus Limnocylindrales bacterium]